jgi:hypothetical protein
MCVTNDKQPYEQQAAIVVRVVIVAWRSCSCCSLELMKLVARADDEQVLSIVVTTDNRAYKKTGLSQLVETDRL